MTGSDDHADPPRSQQQPPAGWYADPSAPGFQRYWDGQQWTAHQQPDASTAASQPTITYSRPTPARPGRGLAAGAVAAIAAAALVVGALGGFLVGRGTADDGTILGGRSEGSLTVGDTREFPLRGDDLVLELVVDEGQDVRIEARSFDIDTTLALYDPDGDEIAYDDDGLGQGTDSLIDRFLDPGRYELVVAPFGGGPARGTVTIAVR